MHILLPIAMPLQYQFDFIVRLIECKIFLPKQRAFFDFIQMQSKVDIE